MSNEVSIFFSGQENFEISQRVAVLLSKSTMVPNEYRNNIANAMVALEISSRLNMSPLMVMQNLHVIHGKPSWSSKALIAMFNKCGRFGSIKYEFTGEKGKPSYGCIAYTTDLNTSKRVAGPEVTIDIADKEGWLKKNGSKWKTMPDLMLRYRASSWLINTVAPDISFGLNTADEVADFNDIRDITPREPSNEPITAEPSNEKKKTRAQQIIETQTENSVQDSKETAIEGDII